jgi:uncharacterized repeat protein (TIGR02543 family)
MKKILYALFASLLLAACVPTSSFSSSLSVATNQVTVTFDSKGGTSINPIVVNKGEFIDIPLPTKTGYTFEGWYTSINNGVTLDQKWNFFTSPININLTLFANWNINQYTITFNVNGGTSVQPLIENFETNLDMPITSRTGHSFSGWYLDANLTQLFTMSTMPAENITLNAKWTINQYTITFESNGGTLIDIITFDFGSSIQVPESPGKVGHTFGGWFLDNNLTEEFTQLVMPAENITLYAKWTINQYTITFETNGGTTIEPIIFDYGSSIRFQGNPIKIGYTFAGWHIDGNLTQLFTLATMPAENVTLYSKWIINQYTITFETSGGTTIEPITLDFGISVRVPENPTKLGHSFGGWFSNQNFTMDYTFPVTMPAENITLYAKWTINQYTITFETNGGNAIEPITLDFGDTVELPQEPSKTGHTFVGWFTDLNFSNELVDTTMPAENINLYAKWTTNSYTITYITFEEGYDPTGIIPLDSGDKIIQSSLGGKHSAVITLFGRVFTWGDNESGQLGDGTNTESLTPIEITSNFSLFDSEKITSISFGYSFSTAITSIGRVFTWGTNTNGQLGNGNNLDNNTPQAISFISLESGEIVSNVVAGQNQSIALTNFGRVFSWGSNSSHQLGDGTNIDRNIPVNITSSFNLSGLENITMVASGSRHSAAITSTGRIFTWGFNLYGQLGDGTTNRRDSPFEITGKFNLVGSEKISSVSLGIFHSAAITSNGRIFSWGLNSSGQLGVGGSTQRTTPEELTSYFNLQNLENITNIELGGYHSTAISSLGRVFSWGENASGQIGGTTTNRSKPYDITLNFNFSNIETPVNLSLGDYHSSIITTTGRIFTWGRNFDGQIGNNTTISANLPNQISFNSVNYKEISFNTFDETISHPLVQREGFVFDGWYLDSSLINEFVDITMPANNLTLYGKWKLVDSL